MSLRTTTGALALAAAALLGACGSSKSGSAASDISVTKAWVRATSTEQTAAYATLRSAKGDRLMKVTIDTSIAGQAQLHQTMVVDTTMMGAATTMAGAATMAGAGEMTMQPLNALVLPAGKDVVMKAGSYHIMLMQLTRPLVKGTTVDLTFSFEKAGNITVKAEVTDVAP
jgi:copper(I)-binding protein